MPNPNQTVQAVQAEPSDEIKTLLAQLQAANERIEALGRKSVQALTLKVSEKGCLSVYGLGRFPVTLYVGQWDRLIGATDQIKTFIEKNRKSLAVKS